MLLFSAYNSNVINIIIEHGLRVEFLPADDDDDDDASSDGCIARVIDSSAADNTSTADDTLSLS